MATSKIPITTGSGLNIATVSISEDAVTKELQRVILVDTTGGTIGIATSPISITGTGLTVTNVLSATGVVVASITTGTMNVVNVLSASGITVASVATGTFTISGTPSFVLTTTTFGAAGGVVATAHASRFQGYVVATTSAAGGVIVVTSAANTYYITDIVISVTGPCNVQLCSETTALAQVLLAANGGWAQSFVSPLKCNSAQSIRVVLSSSGVCPVAVQGYTVT